MVRYDEKEEKEEKEKEMEEEEEDEGREIRKEILRELRIGNGGRNGHIVGEEEGKKEK